jgi:hypothetical protein
LKDFYLNTPQDATHSLIELEQVDAIYSDMHHNYFLRIGRAMDQIRYTKRQIFPKPHSYSGGKVYQQDTVQQIKGKLGRARQLASPS